jgi:3-dehydro-L-gulonate 2-dehydrogenase
MERSNTSTVYIPVKEMYTEFVRILKKHGFSDPKAGKCADIFTINSLEGVYSHGVNRFARFIESIEDGHVKPDAEPSLNHSSGSIEQWNGNLGPGPLNAVFATDRAISIAKEKSIGLVAIANTNHWMRGGTYGWHAAKKGYAFIGWTNTYANMPAWGAKDPRLGNNPFVLAVPFNDEAIVLDFAMTQYSYGKMESYLNDEKQLPYPGGFNSRSELTTEPGDILETWRTLPIGYWKGAGLSLLLDILAATLSGGFSTHEITQNKAEYALSQIFIVIDLEQLGNYPAINHTINKIVTDIKASVQVDDNHTIRYPGENIIKTRNENLNSGIPVKKKIWEKIVTL